MKFCKDCANFIPDMSYDLPPNQMRFAHCAVTAGPVNVVTGEPGDLMRCADYRISGCGIEAAIRFVPKAEEQAA